MELPVVVDSLNFGSSAEYQPVSSFYLDGLMLLTAIHAFESKLRIQFPGSQSY